jgi:hypothetical protein
MLPVLAALSVSGFLYQGVICRLHDSFIGESCSSIISVVLCSYWDDWVRQPEQRRNRACIRPEISRTRTFGKIGVSK